MGRRSLKARAKPPLEYSLLHTATLCLLAFGAVMVYSSSSAESLLGGSGDSAYFLKRYLFLGALGLVAILVMLFAPQGLWGLIRARTGAELFPLSRRVRGLPSERSR